MVSRFTNIKNRARTAKISTMPRSRSEATVHLELYKLLVEKQRLQQELDTLEQRQQQIHERLAVLNTQVTELEVAKLEKPVTRPTSVNPTSTNSAEQSPFDTFLLEY